MSAIYLFFLDKLSLLKFKLNVMYVNSCSSSDNGRLGNRDQHTLSANLFYMNLETDQSKIFYFAFCILNRYNWKYNYIQSVQFVLRHQNFSQWQYMNFRLILTHSLSFFLYSPFKGSERQCMVIKLRMQYCGEFFQESLETSETFLRCIFVQ